MMMQPMSVLIARGENGKWSTAMSFMRLKEKERITSSAQAEVLINVETYVPFE